MVEAVAAIRDLIEPKPTLIKNVEICTCIVKILRICESVLTSVLVILCSVLGKIKGGYYKLLACTSARAAGKLKIAVTLDRKGYGYRVFVVF